MNTDPMNYPPDDTPPEVMEHLENEAERLGKGSGASPCSDKTCDSPKSQGSRLGRYAGSNEYCSRKATVQTNRGAYCTYHANELGLNKGQNSVLCPPTGSITASPHEL